MFRRLDAGAPLPCGITGPDGYALTVRRFAVVCSLFFCQQQFVSTLQVCRVRCNNRRSAFELLADKGALQHDESKRKFRSNCSEKKSMSVISACGTLVVSRIEFVAQVPRLFWLRSCCKLNHDFFQNRCIQLVHCSTPPCLQGCGYAAALARIVFEACCVAGVVVDPVCTYLTCTFLPRHSHLLELPHQVPFCLSERPPKGRSDDKVDP